MQLGIAHDAAFADFAAADFELRFDQDDHAALGREQVYDSRNDQRDGDEADVAHGEIESGFEIGGREIAGVDAFADLDARIVAQPPVELAASDIDCDHAGGSALQKAIRESAGGGAYVETDEFGGIGLEVIEGCGEFDLPPRLT